MKTKQKQVHIFIRGILFFAAGFIAGVCHGDRVLLRNEDRLSGEITSIADGKVIIRTEMAGTVVIKLEDVVTLSTDKTMEVNLRDGTNVKRKLGSSSQGQVSLIADPNECRETKTVLLSDVASVSGLPEKPGWKGAISGGLILITGNTSSESFSAGFDLQKRGTIDRLTFGGELARTSQRDDDTGDEDTTEDWGKLRSKYDYFLSRQLYVYGNGRYESDRVADLTRRVVVGGGPGYQWIESPRLNVSTEAGIAEVIEEYEDNTRTAKEISYQFSSHLDGQFNHKLKLLHDFSYFPSMEEFSDYYLTTTGEIRAGLTDRVYASLKIIFDYDSTPAEDACTTDIKYILGVGYEF